MFDEDPIQNEDKEAIFLSFDSIMQEDIEDRYSPGGGE